MQTLNFVKSELTENKSYDTYLTALRANIRGLYREQLSLFQFIDAMMSTVERNLTQAWNAGASECGLAPGEFTAQELAVRDNYLNNQFRYIYPLGEAIKQDRNNVRIGDALQRAVKWANRWYEMYNLARLTVCADVKYMWQIGKAEHCVTCLQLNGRVMRASRWQELDVWPQDTRPGKLDCHGFNCQCRLVRTDARLTPGPLPRLK